MWKTESEENVVCNIPIRDAENGGIIFKSKTYIGIGTYGEIYKMFKVEYRSWSSWFNADSNDDENFYAADNIPYNIVLLTEFPDTKSYNGD